MPNKISTSWEGVEGWYAPCVGAEGHYYHRSLILPGAIRLLKLAENRSVSLLDLGCGEGVFERILPSSTDYMGIDAAKPFIERAQKLSRRTNSSFLAADATQKLPLEKKDFDCACFILSLQNIERPDLALLNARRHLRKGGKLLIVLNHPCFRIPRQSSWEVDDKNKLQYRRINRYMTPMEIPIRTIAEKDLPDTISFHHPLSFYVEALSRSNFSVAIMEEWCSDKSSVGANAKMENRARAEFPLFLAIVAEAH